MECRCGPATNRQAEQQLRPGTCGVSFDAYLSRGKTDTQVWFARYIGTPAGARFANVEQPGDRPGAMTSLGYDGLRPLDASDTFCSAVIALLPEGALIRASSLAAWSVAIPENGPNRRISVDLTAGSRGLKSSAQELNRE